MIFFFFFLIFFPTLLAYNKLPDGSASLYQPGQDNVELLNSDNIKSTVFGSNKAWFVEFYSHWCGACQRFSAHWKDLAQKTKPWHSRVINIAAINCADPKNDNICREFNIEYFPTLRLFPPNADFQNPDHDSKLINNRDDLENKIIEFLDQVNPVPPEWPIFKEYTSKRLDTIFLDNKDAKHGFLVFEDIKSIMGKQLMLDFSDRTDLVIRRATPESNSFLMEKFQIEKRKLPVVYLIFNSKGSMKKHVEFSENFVSKNLDGGQDARTRYKILINEFKKKGNQNEDLAQEEELRGNEENSSNNKSIFNQNKVYMQDLESGLNMILRFEVPRSKLINGEKKVALNKWIKALVKYFPGRKEVRNYLTNLDRKLSSVNSDEITGDQWIQMTKEDQNNESYLPESTEWAHCKGSTPNYRGFPCSLWTLFHTLTVRQYELEIAKSKPFEHRFDVREVIDSVRFFVKHFFRCSECSKNFKKETYDYLDHLNKPQDAVLYLWKVHNSVNKRLANDITEDPAYPKDQFPSKNLCSDCYDSNNQLIEQRVFDFLLSFYSTKNMLPATNQHLPEDKINTRNLHKLRLEGQKDKSILEKFQPSTGLYIGIFLITVTGLMLLFIGIRKSRTRFGSL